MSLIETLRVLDEARGDSVGGRHVNGTRLANGVGSLHRIHSISFTCRRAWGRLRRSDWASHLATARAASGRLLWRRVAADESGVPGDDFAAARPANLTLLVFDNGAYEVTGGTADACRTGRSCGEVDLAGMAVAAGISSVSRIEKLEEWRAEVSQVLSAPGPVCAVLKVESNPGGGPVGALPPASERAAAFATALATADSPVSSLRVSKPDSPD